MRAPRSRFHHGTWDDRSLPQFDARRLARRVMGMLRRLKGGSGGSVWESNPPEPPKAPPSGFEDRASHQAKSAPPGQATL